MRRMFCLRGLFLVCLSVVAGLAIGCSSGGGDNGDNGGGDNGDNGGGGNGGGDGQLPDGLRPVEENIIDVSGPPTLLAYISGPADEEPIDLTIRLTTTNFVTTALGANGFNGTGLPTYVHPLVTRLGERLWELHFLRLSRLGLITVSIQPTDVTTYDSTDVLNLKDNGTTMVARDADEVVLVNTGDLVIDGHPLAGHYLRRPVVLGVAP